MTDRIPIRTIVLTCSLLLQMGALTFDLRASPGDVDLSFDPGSGVNGEVKAMALQPDGKLIVGGRFTTVRGLARQGIARLNPDGSGDPTFDAGTNADQYISAIAIQSDGKMIFIRGDYPNWTDHKVARLNTDGTLDTSFVPAVGTFPSAFTSMALQTDGRIVLGGYSSEPDGLGNFYDRTLLMRLNANGAIDNTFTNDYGIFGQLISSLALQPDGKILIAGYIVTSVNGTNHYNLLRLNANGSVDTNFNAVEGIIHSVGLQSDGKILLAGYGIGNSTNWNGVARLNADGTLDATFQPGTDSNSSLASIAIQPDGKVICLGGYIYVSGTNRNAIVRLNSNGTVDAGFNATTEAPNNDASAVALQPDGRILLGGGFTLVNGTNRERLARLNFDGSLDNSLNPGSSINGGVNSLALQGDGKVLIGGNFTVVGGALRNTVSRLNANGTLDPTFDPHTGPEQPYNGFLSVVTAVAIQPNGKVLVGGDFRSFNGLSRNRLVRLNSDGTVDTNLVPWIGAPLANESFQPFTLLVQPDGKILVGGNGALASNSDRAGLARLNVDGSYDATFHPETTNGDYTVINSLALQPDGKILAGGYFVQSDVPYLLLTRLNANGSRDTNFPTAGGSAGVTTIALQTDGKILVGGWYGDNLGWISRLNTSGNADNTFSAGSGADNTISVILVQSNGKILVAGLFTSFNGTNCNHIARLNANGSLDTSFNAGAGVDGVVRSVALQPDGNVLVGGNFITSRGALRPRIARIYGDSTLPMLSIARSNASVILSWPVTGLDFQLEESTNIVLSNWWSAVVEGRQTNGAQLSLTVPTSAGQKFFRLKSP